MIVGRQLASGMYPGWTYAYAVNLADLPISIGVTLIVCVPVYLLVSGVP